MEYAGSGIVTRQGQITVPKKVRDSTGIEVGTVLEFYYNDEIMIVKPKRSPLRVFKEVSEKASKRFEKRKISREDLEEEIDSVRKGD